MWECVSSYLGIYSKELKYVPPVLVIRGPSVGTPSPLFVPDAVVVKEVWVVTSLPPDAKGCQSKRNISKNYLCIFPILHTHPVHLHFYYIE